MPETTVFFFSTADKKTSIAIRSSGAHKPKAHSQRTTRWDGELLPSPSASTPRPAAAAAAANPTVASGLVAAGAAGSGDVDAPVMTALAARGTKLHPSHRDQNTPKGAVVGMCRGGHANGFLGGAWINDALNLPNRTGWIHQSQSRHLLPGTYFACLPSMFGCIPS